MLADLQDAEPKALGCLVYCAPTADCRLPTADCRSRANANWHISHRVRVWVGAYNRWSRAGVRRGLPFTEQKPLVEPNRALLGAWQAGGRSSSPSAR